MVTKNIPEITRKQMRFMKSRKKQETVTLNGITVNIQPYMFSPESPYSYSTKVLLESMRFKKNERVLELGIGCGILSVFAAKQGAKVDGVDILPECIKFSQMNALKNGVSERTQFYQSNMFSNIGGKFDTIICNLPILNGELPKNDARWYSLFDPSFKFHKELFDKGRDVAPKIIMAHADIAGPSEFKYLEQMAQSYGWLPKVKFEKKYAKQKWRSYEFTLGKNKMIDMQNQKDNRMPINRVGIKEIYFPLLIADKNNHIQNTVAKATISVNLPKEVRGAHMSRFVEVINEITKQQISMNDLSKLLENIKNKLDAKAAHIEIEFKYFIKKHAPVSKRESIMDYDCKFICSFNEEFKKTLVVKVPVTTLCPCSKAISLKSAHNQRSFVTVSIVAEEFIWIEDIISLTESKASCEIYPLLKREDEKYVTEKAYDNPKFVEDMVREVAMTLKGDKRIKEFSVFSEHLESIHNHNAFALIEYKEDEQK